MPRVTRKSTLVNVSKHLDDARRIKKQLDALYPDMRKVPLKDRQAITDAKASIENMIAMLQQLMEQEFGNGRVEVE
jgi:hypothetical protein